MSVDCRYFTNGEKTAFTLLHTDTGEVEVFEKREDIPDSVKHLFRNMNMPKIIGPDLAMILKINGVFYPDWPKICNAPMLNGKKCRCVVESCAIQTTPMGWKTCPFISDTGSEK